jgi:phosphatidylglycerophosphatase A
VGCARLCGAAEQELAQHDPPAVVLDEVWGMAAVVIALPQLRVSWWWLVASLLLFRFFDIVKPPPLKRLAQLPGGWGIMADDLGAAAYTALTLWFLIRLLHFGF